MSILDTIKEVAAQALGFVDTYALYEGTVEQQRADGTLDVKLDDDRFGPGVTEVDMVFGLPGVSATVPKGTRVAVGFHEGRRDKLSVRHYLGGTPITVIIDASATVLLGAGATMGVARLGDTVGPYTITTASTKVKAE